MSEDGDYMDGYNDGFIDGRGTMTKPLRWRTGPVPEDLNKRVLYVTYGGFVAVEHSEFLVNGIERIMKYIPLSEILDLIGE